MLPCQPLVDWLAVPLGDNEARLAMKPPTPDRTLAREGFRRAGNVAEDIGGMIDLYLYFGALPLLREPIEAWRRGAALIAELRMLGERICARSPDAASASQLETTRLELDRLDAGFVDVETRFSAALGHASRLTQRLLSVAVALLAPALVADGSWFVLRSWRSQIDQRRGLLEAHARWNLAADAAGVGLFVWHPADDMIKLDRRARLLYGLDPDAPLTRPDLSARVHPDDRGDFDRLSQNTLIGKEHLRARYRIRKADGSVRHIEAIGTLHEGGALPTRRQMFGVVRGVTDEVASARLQIDKNAAERSAQTRSEFLPRLSHELRTPLNAILGFAQLLHIGAAHPLTGQQRQRVDLILEGGWHLLHLVDDVLDITRIDAGQSLVKLVPTDLTAVLRASLNLIEPERLRLAIRVVERWPAQPARVIVDPQRLRQVFVNLLGTACKYNRRGGRAHAWLSRLARSGVLEFRG